MNENGEIILAFDKETGELKEYVEPFAAIVEKQNIQIK